MERLYPMLAEFKPTADLLNRFFGSDNGKSLFSILQSA